MSFIQSRGLMSFSSEMCVAFLPDSLNKLLTFCCFSVKLVGYCDAEFPGDCIFWELAVFMACWIFLYTIDLRFQVSILSILFEGAKFKTQDWPICPVNSEQCNSSFICLSGVDGYLSIVDCFLHWKLPSTSGQTLNEGFCDPNSSIRVLVILGWACRGLIEFCSSGQNLNDLMISFFQIAEKTKGDSNAIAMKRMWPCVRIQDISICWVKGNFLDLP